MGKKLQFLLLVCMISSILNVFGQIQNSGLEKGKWIILSVDSGMIKKAKLLDKAELLDQYRDWIEIAAIKKMRFDKNTNFRILYDYSPMRNEESSGISNYNYGEGRHFAGPHETLYIFTPKNSSSSDKIIGESADEYRKLTGKMPLTVKHLEYLIDTATTALSFRYSADIDVNQIYSTKYGYVEATVSDLKSLTAFLTNIDDLVGAATVSNKVVLKGRRYPGDRRKNLDAEDVAVLYKAEHSLFEDYSRRLKIQDWEPWYNSAIKEQVKSLKTKYPQIASKYTDEEVEQQLKAEVPYDAFLKKNMADFKAQVSSYSPGFSLDFGLKNEELSIALSKILRGDEPFVDSLVHSSLFADSAIDTHETKYAFGSIENWEAKQAIKTEKNFETFMGIVPDKSSLEDRLFINATSGSERRHKLSNEIVRAFQNDKRLIEGIIQQIKDKHATDNFRLYNYLQRYITGEYQFNLTGVINPAWPVEKRLMYSKISNDFGDIVRQNRDIANKLAPLPDSSNATIVKAILRKIKQPSLTYSELSEILPTDTEKVAQLNALGNILQELKTKYQYQKATYIGDLQGTKVGMTLFYTDLLMKLWGFDFKNTMPNIPGFLSEINFKISPFYADEINKNPTTRFWLGPLSSAVRASDKGGQIYFSTYATKVFCASSNDLFHGAEVRANYIDRRFTDWWNKHYDQVADYEPEYHRLNQIMKWHIVLLWLKRSNQFSWLNDQKILTTNLNFENWYKKNSTLKVRVDVPFLPSDLLNEKTECLDLLKNKYIDLYERPYSLGEPNYNCFYGGVSLPSESEMEVNILKSGRRVADELLDRNGLKLAENGIESKILINEGKS